MNKVEVIEINQGTIIKSNDLKSQIVSEINRFNDEGYKVVSTEIIKNKLNSNYKHAERLFMMVFLEKN
jgi:phosphosulfolactate synthase (CoM biosynthesis protein A)